MSKKKKVLLIGWDAADWQIINPLIERGLMPTLQKFLAEAASGNIATLDPPYSPMLWTSIATGKHPYEHGVLGFTEVLPDGSGIRGVSTHSRKVKAIWNILNQEGLKSNVVSWWPSNPVEDINGVMVSNFYQHAHVKYGEDWPLLAGTVNKEEHRAALAELRLHPEELTASHLKPFIPNLGNIKVEEDKILPSALKILAHVSCVHNATTYLLDETEWDFMGVYHDGIDHMCHLAMKYRAPHLPGIEDEKFNNYQEMVDGMYRFHDMMLERTLEMVDEDTYVMIVSDHGFRSDDSRYVSLPVGPATPAIEHRPYGMIAIKGPGIKKGEKIYGASVLDVTPTLLYTMGLPVGQDMAGNILTNAFVNPAPPSYIPSWETVPGDAAMLKDSATTDPIAEAQAMEQLIELGYVEKQDKDIAKRIEITKRETEVNLAKSYIHAGKKEKAIPILEKVCEDYPHKVSRLTLLNLYIDAGKISKAEKLLEECKDIYPESTNLKYNEALIFWLKGHRMRAMQLFDELVVERANSEMLRQIGKTYNIHGMHQKAREVLEKALEMDEDDTLINHQLGVALLRLGEYELALERFFKVVEVFYHFSKAHFFIGEILYHLGYFENAAEALEVAAAMAPKDAQTRKWLMKIYREHLNNPELAAMHENALPDRSKEIVVVSGLPRSGTSMMMQMLEKGGIVPLTDHERKADENNPHGYYELQRVKNMANDVKWMAEAEGKSIKIIAQLLPFLPEKHRYKIIFLEREISEVLISQQLMLGKPREEAIKNYPFKLAQTYFEQLERVNQWVEKQPFIEMLTIQYNEAVNHPEEVVKRIAEFLDRDLDTDKMIEAVDKKLYRNQTS